MMPQIQRISKVRLSVRHLSSPRKSFESSRTTLQYFWNDKVPVNLKYGTGIVALATSIANIHPNVLITLGPPLGVASYFVYRHLIERTYTREVELARNSKHKIEIPKYDETDVNQVLNGINNEFDYFKSQVFLEVTDLINSNINGSNDHLFVDSNNQVNWKFGDVENFIVSNIDNSKFIKMGVAFKRKERVGVVEIYMVESEGDFKGHGEGKETESGEKYDIKVIIVSNGEEVII